MGEERLGRRHASNVKGAVVIHCQIIELHGLPYSLYTAKDEYCTEHDEHHFCSSAYSSRQKLFLLDLWSPVLVSYRKLQQGVMCVVGATRCLLTQHVYI